MKGFKFKETKGYENVSRFNSNTLEIDLKETFMQVIHIPRSRSMHTELTIELWVKSKYNRVGIDARLYSKKRPDVGSRVYRSLSEKNDGMSKISFRLDASTDRRDTDLVLEISGLIQNVTVVACAELVTTDGSNLNPVSERARTWTGSGD